MKIRDIAINVKTNIFDLDICIEKMLIIIDNDVKKILIAIPIIEIFIPAIVVFILFFMLIK